jgi:hypothetical protein
MVLIPAIAIATWASWNTYNYFFDTTNPVVTLTGIETDEHYAGDITCIVDGSDDYKVYDISVFLDNKVLVGHHKINRSSFQYSFPVATKVLTSGKHILKITVQDGSFNKNSTTKEVPFFVDNSPIQAAFIKSDADLKVFQGRTLHLQFQMNKEIKSAVARTLAQTYTCVPEAPNSLIYECFIPIKSDEIPNEYLIHLDIIDKVNNTLSVDNKFHIVMYPFKKQQLTLNTEKIKLENELGLSERQLEADLEEATRKSPATKLWQGSFYVPCDMKGISTEFGTLRTTQERGKYPHNAIDLLGAPRSVVWATQDGIITIKNRYAHSGNTIVIDHGCGILSLFFHLEDFAPLNVGDKIKKGKPIGTLGMTGYASGYHLHWGLRINNIDVDPMQWTRHDF